MSTHVLIVDDKEENIYFLRALLEGHGYHVSVARDGAEALATARAEPPDLVVADLLMPVMDGYTLLRHWKADPLLHHAPFAVYTATYTDPEDERLALALGADAFILKPAEPDALLAHVVDLAARASASPAAPPRRPEGDEEERLEAYNGVLVRKLEQKMLQLEEANRALQQDIVARTRAQRQLEQATTLLRIAGRAAHLGGWVLNADEGTVMWSDETCAIHGHPAGYVPTLEEALNFYVPEDRHVIARHVEACAEDGTPFDTELQIITAKGRRVWIRAVGEAIRDDAGAIVRVQGAVQDVSERRLLEQKFLRAQRMESISTLTSGMAHDLNNVLAPILLSVQLLKGAVTDEEALETLGTLESCAERGAEMVRQVLSFARGIDPERVEVDLARVLADVERALRDSFPPSISIRTVVPEDLWELKGDPTRFHQVFMNLFTNARDAMPDGGRLTVTAENVDVDEHYAAMMTGASPGPHVRVSVVDTGVGMTPDTLDQIFDPLFTTKAEGGGTGLGLSTVAAIVRSHGGFVHAYSEPGAGATFRFHFPATVHPGIAPSPGPELDTWQGHDQLVLVVDDEGAVRSITQQTLEAFGYRVLIASDGAQALDIYRTRAGEIDVVLTDTNMPEMDGPALIQALVAMDPAVRIIAASGMGSGGTESKAATAGARYFIPKPYTANTLLSAIHEALHANDRSKRSTNPEPPR